jgi:predicted TIM-barrel fold metal-dependent hydrolase
MDQIGVDIQVLHNTMWIEQVTNRPEAEVALCRSYNRWLGDIWSRSGGRLRWSCLPPTLDIPSAVQEIRWSKEHGAAAVCMRPYEGERVLIDKYFYPVFEAAQEADLAIAVHIANGSPSMVELLRTAPFFCRFRGQIPAAVNAYLTSEIPELFPRLRVGFIEAGSQWLPWVLLSVTRGMRLTKADAPGLLRRKRVWVTCENDDDLSYIVGWAGEDNLLIGTDYGHTDPSSNVQALRQFATRTDISDEVKQKIVRDNPQAYYGITNTEVSSLARERVPITA